MRTTPVVAGHQASRPIQSAGRQLAAPGFLLSFVVDEKPAVTDARNQAGRRPQTALQE